MPLLFGTDGIRGTFNKYPITEKFFHEFAGAIEHFFIQLLNKTSLRLAIGHDTRESGTILKKSFINGLSSNVFVLDCGIIPTPGISIITQYEKCDLGVMITASHNLYSDNGIKIFNSNGEKLSVDLEKDIEKFFEKFSIGIKIPSKKEPIVVNFHKQALNNFAARFKDIYFQVNEPIVLDTANGATTYTSPMILEKFCTNLITVYNSPNGNNINDNCGSEYIDNIKTIVKKTQSYAGIAHDGDGDRLIMVDETGKCLNGDQIIGIIANYLKEKNLLLNNTIVVTQQSNSGLDESLSKNEINVIRTDVGDRNVYYSMLQHNCILGGEESGHIILKNLSNTGDAIAAAILILKISLEKNLSLSKLKKQIHLFPKHSINIYIEQKLPLSEFSSLQVLLRDMQINEPNYKRSLIRYSGTENKLRILVEATNEAILPEISEKIYNCIRKEFEKRKIFIK